MRNKWEKHPPQLQGPQKTTPITSVHQPKPQKKPASAASTPKKKASCQATRKRSVPWAVLLALMDCSQHATNASQASPLGVFNTRYVTRYVPCWGISGLPSYGCWLGDYLPFFRPFGRSFVFKGLPPTRVFARFLRLQGLCPLAPPVGKSLMFSMGLVTGFPFESGKITLGLSKWPMPGVSFELSWSRPCALLLLCRAIIHHNSGCTPCPLVAVSYFWMQGVDCEIIAYSLMNQVLYIKTPLKTSKMIRPFKAHF